MSSPLVRKLTRILELRPADIAALSALGGPVRRCRAGQDLITAGRQLRSAVLVHEGWAFRHRTLADGRRLVLDFVLPGDLCDPTVFVTPRANFSLQALTDLRYSRVPGTDLLDLLQSHPRVGAAFWWSEAHEEAITRAHLMAVGRLTAYERVAYLLWELWVRLSLVDLADGQGFVLPASQELIADAAGLSSVHVNRMLGRLAREGLIRRHHREFTILDVPRLRHIVQVSDGLNLTPLPPWIQRRLRD